MQVYQRRNPDVKQPPIVSKIDEKKGQPVEINNLPGKKISENYEKVYLNQISQFPQSKTKVSPQSNVTVTKRQSYLCSIKIVKKQSPLTSPSTLTRP